MTERQVISRIVNVKAVKELLKTKNKRCGKDFIDCLAAHVELKVLQAASIHNGGKKTVDRSVAQFVGIIPK